MSAPIDLRVEKLLRMMDRNGIPYDTVRVRGDLIEIVCQQPKPKGRKTTDLDTVDWSR